MLNGQWHTRDGAGLKVLKAAPIESSWERAVGTGKKGSWCSAKRGTEPEAPKVQK